MLHDVNAGGGGNTGPAGIVLVTTTGANVATAFSLNPGSSDYTTIAGQAVLKKGLWVYALANRPTASVLVSAPGAEAFQFAPLASAAQQVWSMGAVWQDRQDDLRDGSEPLAAADRPVQLADLDGGSLPLSRVPTFEPGVWLKAVGDWSSRSDHVSPMAGVTYDSGYSQSDYGMVGGVDATHRNLFGDGDVALAGVSLGYLSSDLNFNASPSKASFAGWTYGLYGSYIRDHVFVDVQANGDVLDLRMNAPTVPFTGKTHADSNGGQISGGLRYALGGGVIEPSATLAGVVTDIGDLHVAGTTVHPGVNDSLRAGVGLRYSGTVASTDRMQVRLSGEAKLWNEFDADNQVNLLTAGPTLPLSDNLRGVFGELDGGLSLFGVGGHVSGFIDGSVKFKAGYVDSGARLGVRYQW